MSDEQTNIDFCEHGTPLDQACTKCIIAKSQIPVPTEPKTIVVEDDPEKVEENLTETDKSNEREKQQAEAHQAIEKQGGDRLTESEAILGFLDTMRKQPQLFQFSKRHREPQINSLLLAFCQANNLELPRGHWRNLVEVPLSSWRDKS